MSDEEKEALEWLENDVKKSKELRDKWHMYMVSNKNEVLLNLIKKQNDVIDMMAEGLSTPIHNKEWIKNFYYNKPNKKLKEN